MIRAWRTKAVVLMGMTVLVFAGSSSAMADTVNFSLSDGTNTISFSLPSSPTPDFTAGSSTVPIGFGFVNVPIVYDGSPEKLNVLFDINTGEPSTRSVGGLAIGDVPTNPIWLLNQQGSQLYTGPVSTPTFILGTFDLTNVREFEYASTLTTDFTLTVTDVSASVPEPGTLRMVVLGVLLLLGLQVFRIRRGRLQET